jgi:hypothetical protein
MPPGGVSSAGGDERRVVRPDDAGVVVRTFLIADVRGYTRFKGATKGCATGVGDRASPDVA